MRITESYLLNNLSSNVETSSANFQLYQQELATGKRINQPSDDPVGTAKSLALRDVLSGLTQYTTNNNSAKSFLSYSDTQLSSVTSLIQQARQITVAVANGATQDAQTTQTYSKQLDSIMQQLTSLANTQLSGQYIFSGTATSTAPFTYPDPTHTYAGNAGAITATTGPNQSMQLNTPGSQIFSPIFSAIESVKTDMASGNYTNISNTDLASIDTSLNAVLSTRAGIGENLNQISDNQSRIQTSQTSLQDQLSSVEDTDIASTYADMQIAQNVYQASLVTTSKALSMSLADYLK